MKANKQTGSQTGTLERNNGSEGKMCRVKVAPAVGGKAETPQKMDLARMAAREPQKIRQEAKLCSLTQMKKYNTIVRDSRMTSVMNLPLWEAAKDVDKHMLKTSGEKNSTVNNFVERRKDPSHCELR